MLSLTLEDAPRYLVLAVNEAKTKHMRVGGAGPGSGNDCFEAGEFHFQRVRRFLYLGSEVNPENNLSREINRWTAAANRCYFGLAKHFRSRFLSNRTKINLYKTLIRPVLTNGSEAWAFTKADEKRLIVFKRSILRKVFGPVREGDVWKRRKSELSRLLGDIDVVKFVKLGRHRW